MSKIGNQKAKDSLFGNFPSHTKVRNIYFATLNAIITLGDVSEMICEGLLNVIFKLDLRKYTDKVASFQNESFHFTLITGIGMLAGDSTISVDVASVYPEEITTSLLLKMISNRKTRTLEIRPRKGYIQPHKGGSSASLKYEIFVNKFMKNKAIGAASTHKNHTTNPPRIAPKLFPVPPTITMTQITNVYLIGL